MLRSTTNSLSQFDKLQRRELRQVVAASNAYEQADKNPRSKALERSVYTIFTRRGIPFFPYYAFLRKMYPFRHSHCRQFCPFSIRLTRVNFSCLVCLFEVFYETIKKFPLPISPSNSAQGNPTRSSYLQPENESLRSNGCNTRLHKQANSKLSELTKSFMLHGNYITTYLTGIIIIIIINIL